MFQHMEMDKGIEYDIDAFAKMYPLYDGPRPVAAAKRADLRALAEHLPIEERQQYYDLTTDEAVEDSGNELEDQAAVIVEGADGAEDREVLMIGN